MLDQPTGLVGVEDVHRHPRRFATEHLHDVQEHVLTVLEAAEDVHAAIRLARHERGEEGLEAVLAVGHGVRVLDVPIARVLLDRRLVVALLDRLAVQRPSVAESAGHHVLRLVDAM